MWSFAKVKEAQKGGGGVEVYLYSFFILGARFGWSKTRPTALPPGKRSGPHCIVGWVGPRARVDGCGKSRPNRDSVPGPSSLSLTSYVRPYAEGQISFHLYAHLNGSSRHQLPTELLKS